MPDPQSIAPTGAELAIAAPSRGSVLGQIGGTARTTWGWAVAALAVLTSVILQGNVYLNHDVGWVLYSSARMLEGQVFSRDIVAANPPLIWYLNLPPAWLAKATGVSDPTVFRLYVLGLAVLCLTLSVRSLKGTSWGRDPVLSQSFIALAAVYWLLLSGREFGQREHLMLMLVTPYLLLAAASLSGNHSAIGLSLACGVLAGIGFALKPYFLAVPLLIELHQLLARRPFQWAPRLELVAMAATGGLYLLSIPILAPDYVSSIIPMVKTIYWGFDGSLIAVLARIWAELILLPVLLALLVYNRGRPSDLQWVLGIASVGLFFAYVLQKKAFAYHAYPFQGLLSLWFLVNVGALLRSPGFSRRKASAWVWAMLALAGLSLPLGAGSSRVFTWYSDANIESGALGQETSVLIDLVNRHAGGEYFVAFSTHPYPGFPISNYSQARWGARTNSHFMVPAVAKSRERKDGAGPAARKEIERTARQFVLDDLIRFDPALVLVDDRPKRFALRTTSFDMLGFYLEDPRFREIWTGYTELPSVHGFRVFVRSAYSSGQGGANP